MYKNAINIPEKKHLKVNVVRKFATRLQNKQKSVS